MLLQFGIRLLRELLPRHARNDKFEILQEIRNEGPIFAIVDIRVSLHLLGKKTVVEAFVGFEFLEFFDGNQGNRVVNVR